MKGIQYLSYYEVVLGVNKPASKFQSNQAHLA